MKLVISLCDYSGSWALPWLEHDYTIWLVDPKHPNPDLDSQKVVRFPFTISEFVERTRGLVLPCTDLVVLAAPPCTHFTNAGAQYWKEKDADGRTTSAVQVVYSCLEFIAIHQPRVWALENPVGRLPKLVPELGEPWYFQPCDYGDAYTKKTGLWGNFNRELKQNKVQAVQASGQGSWLQRLGGSSEATKTARSNTPFGFARAFAFANSLKEPSCTTPSK